MSNPGGWFEIYVNDIARAKAFYEKVFQTKLEQLGAATPGVAMWAFPASRDGYGCGGAIVKMDGMAAGGNSTLVYFSCKDCAVEEARIAGAGGKVLKPKFSIGPHGFIAIVQDSEGNAFGLHSMS